MRRGLGVNTTRVVLVVFVFFGCVLCICRDGLQAISDGEAALGFFLGDILHDMGSCWRLNSVDGKTHSKLLFKFSVRESRCGD